MPDTRSFNERSFPEKLEILYAASAVDKRYLILASPEARRLVRSFTPESLFYTIKELGVYDSPELLAFASGSQVCALLDLDCWQKDRVSISSLVGWLEILIEGGDRALGEFLNAADLSLLVLVFKRHIQVYRTDDPEEPPDVDGPEIFELDPHYQIVFPNPDTRTPILRRVLEALYERDYSYFVTVMEHVWWDVESELEESSFGLRNARLQDRGFPDYFEALEIYQPLRREDLPSRIQPLGRSLARWDDDGGIPLERSLLVPNALGTILSELLASGFDPEAQGELRQEMAFLTNRVMIAEGVDYGERDSVSEAIRLGHDTVNLALEHLSKGKREAAAARLTETHLQHLFRFGWSTLLDLHRQTRGIVDGLGETGTATLRFLDSPFREVLEGCLRKKPRYFEGLDTPGELSYRPFRSVAELARAREILELLEELPELSRARLGQDLADIVGLRPSGADEFRLSAVLLTALAHGILGEDASTRPIPLDSLPELRRRSIDEATGRLLEAVRARFFGKESPARPLLDTCVQRFEEEFLALAPDEPVDPRFLTCLMVARPNP